MKFEINNIDHVVVYDKEHNPLFCFDDIPSVEVESDENLQSNFRNGQRVMLSANLNDEIIELSGIYTALFGCEYPVKEE